MGRAPLVAFADICESVRYGYTASASGQEVGPRFLRITDIVPDSIDWDSVPFCEIDDSDKERFALEAGDIVVARTGATVGYAKLIRDSVDAVFASYLVRFRVDGKKADPGFVGRLVESFIYKEFVKSRVGGAAQPNANAQVLGSFQFRMPLRREQERIAGILSAYDDLIENNWRRMALLEEAARQLYREWFVRLRFPGHEHTRITNGVPEGWEKCCIREFGDVVTGKTPSTKDADNYGGEILFIKTPDMHGNVFVIETETRLTEKGANTQPGKFIPTNALLVSCIGTIGVVSLTSAPSQFNQQINAVVPFEDSYRYYCFFAFKDLKDSMEAIGGGATMGNVNKKKFESLKVLKPSMPLLREFHEFCNPLFQQIQVLSYQNQKLRAARDLLLPRLMNGKIAV